MGFVIPQRQNQYIMSKEKHIEIGVMSDLDYNLLVCVIQSNLELIHLIIINVPAPRM